MLRTLVSYIRQHHIGLLALFIALSGTAYAASLPRNSVGTAQLRNSAVTDEKIKKRSIGSSKLKLTRSELRYTVRIPLTTPHGPNPGDIHTFSGALHEGSANAVGSYKGFCIVIDPGPQALQCNVTADVFGQGALTAVGTVGPGGQGGNMVVADGTGRFKDVRGFRTTLNPRREGPVLVAELVYSLRSTSEKK